MQFGNENDQDKFDAWFREKLEHVAQYCFRRQLFSEEIKVESLWVIPHNVLIGQAWPKNDTTNKIWVITGEIVATDHADNNVANNAREAARYFALRWQLQGARVQTSNDEQPDSGNENQVNWKSMGKSLSEKAEMLYTFVNNDQHWNQTQQ